VPASFQTEGPPFTFDFVAIDRTAPETVQVSLIALEASNQFAHIEKILLPGDGFLFSRRWIRSFLSSGISSNGIHFLEPAFINFGIWSWSITFISIDMAARKLLAQAPGDLFTSATSRRNFGSVMPESRTGFLRSSQFRLKRRLFQQRVPYPEGLEVPGTPLHTHPWADVSYCSACMEKKSYSLLDENNRCEA
jgi:hypothetical protein